MRPDQTRPDKMDRLLEKRFVLSSAITKQMKEKANNRKINRGILYFFKGEREREKENASII